MKIIFINKRKIYVVFGLIIIFSLIVLSINESKSIPTLYLPITNKVIGIDPGHGGIDPGAVGKSGMREDEINLEIVLKLKRLIEQSGGIVVTTREDEKGLYTKQSKTLRQKKNEDLRNRKEIIDSADCDIFLSIHLNSFPQAKYYGAQTFYKKDCEKSKILAYYIQDEFKNILDEKNNRVAQERDDVFLIRETDVPSVLIECGFLSNPEEEKTLKNKKYQEKIAWAIYTGIMKYFNR